MMKKITGILLILILLLCFGAAAADAAILGNPFPDFTATDTEGNTFTLSEALKDHEAVLINLWATWCPPCRMEFPHLNKVYEQYGDRVAFIVLSVEENDTMEVIRQFRRKQGLTLPMGRDEGSGLFAYMRGNAIPVTVVVDRFGNAVFHQAGMFTDANEIVRVLRTFLGDQYTESTVLNGIPEAEDTDTRAFSVSAARELLVENKYVKRVSFHIAGEQQSLTGYVVDGDTARLRMKIRASDDPESMAFYSSYQYTILMFPSLLDPESADFVLEVAMPDKAEEYRYNYVSFLDYDLYSRTGAEPDAVEAYLIAGDDYLDEFAGLLGKDYNADVTWEYADAPAPAKGEKPQQAYRLYVRDQNGDPVPEVYVSFCTDTACVPAETDVNGVIDFSGAPETYHVQFVDVPDGYTFDEDFEMTVGPEYGEWMLRIRKNV